MRGSEQWRVRTSILGLLLLALAAWIGCHDTNEPPQPVTVRIEPAEGLFLLPGESYQLNAVATDSRGIPLTASRFVWDSEDETVATVSSSGTVTAHAPGSTLITASFGSVSAQAVLAVLVPVAKLSLEPEAPVAVVGHPVQMVAKAEADNGDPIEDQPISWESSDPSVAQVSTRGLVTPVSPGTATVSAMCGRKIATVSLVVLAPIAALEVMPGGITLRPGDSLQLTATLTDPEGHPLDGRSIDWSSRDSRVATVSESGVVLARRVGTVFILADAEGQRDSAQVEVQAPVSAVRVSPERGTLDTGGTLQLQATPKDANGRVLTGRTVEWKSSDPDVATISTAGLVTAISPGVATISATAEGRVGGSTIAVREPVATITITPASKDLTIDEVYPLKATLRSGGGEVLTGRAIEWSSRDASVARVNSVGQVTARSEGTTTIVARSEGVEGHAEIRVSRPRDEPVVLVGAGDIGTCNGNGDEATARLLDAIPGTVFTAGDNVYEAGSPAEYANCYDPTWGRHKAHTRPVPGNHEYETPGAAGYFNYFGAAAGDPKTGYYSYDLGAWHILALNTQFTGKEDSPQAEWVERDLAAHRRKCTLAIWHVPLFGRDSATVRMKNIYRILYDAGAEVVINGHEHNYQRFAPQTAEGVLDPDRGVREFIIGTGGRGVGGKTERPPNTEMFYNGGFGVLKLTLRANSYDWEFVPVAGTTFTDKGSASCH